MIDERWDPEAAEVAAGLRELLSRACPPVVLRAVEADPDGERARRLAAELGDFGVWALPDSPAILAAVAHELGRALVPYGYPAITAARIALGMPDTALATCGFVPAQVERAVVVNPDASSAVFGVGDPVLATSGELWRPVSGDPREPVESTVADRARRLHVLLVVARLCGAVERLCELGVDYARERVQFGTAIGAFQAVANQLVDARIAVDGLALLVRKAAWTADPHVGGDGAPPEVLTLAMISAAVPRALSVARTVHQVMGGHGFTVEADCQLYSRRLRTWALALPMDVRRARTRLARLAVDSNGRADGGTDGGADLTHLWGAGHWPPVPRWARELDGVR